MVVVHRRTDAKRRFAFQKPGMPGASSGDQAISPPLSAFRVSYPVPVDPEYTPRLEGAFARPISVNAAQASVSTHPGT